MDWDDDDLPNEYDQYEQDHEDELDMLREMESQGKVVLFSETCLPPLSPLQLNGATIHSGVQSTIISTIVA